MGTYLNPGKAAYEEAINSEIYVDKTEMLQFLNTVVKTKQKYVSVSRPRRFGKTMTADMICAYYDRTADSREIFERRKIAACRPAKTENDEIPWDAYLGEFDVVRLVMTKHIKRNKTVAQTLSDMQKLVIREIKKIYPDIDYYDENNLLQWSSASKC